ncbi:MAG: murein biosynthesis integral membrane protein MurJ, partial [Deltaproteobacteria bacterium]|nr:murein biosynthesis integral membrane protein MurJ [Deltaproteobacteria bacterium]
LPGVLFWVVHQLVSRAFYAHEDTLTPAVVGTATTVIFLPVYYLLTKFMGTPGVAVAGVLGIGAYTTAMVAVWRKKHGGAAFTGILPYTLKAVAIAGLPGLAAWLSGMGTASLLPYSPLWGAAAALIVASAVFAVLYLPLACRLAPHLVEPFRDLFRKVRTRIAPKK